MTSRYADQDEYERIKKLILIKSERSTTGRVDCSIQLIRPLSFADRDKLVGELIDKGIIVEWVVHS